MADVSRITDAELNKAIQRGRVEGAHADGAGDAQPQPAPVTLASEIVDMEPPDWRICSNAPAPSAVCSVGEPAILAAPGGTGKSYLALNLALLAIGEQDPAVACGLKVRRGAVLIVSYEDSHPRIGQRIRALSGRSDVADAAPDLARLALVNNPGVLWTAPDYGGSTRQEPAFKALQRRAEILEPSLIVIDPLSAAAAGCNLNDGGAARQCMRDLRDLSDATGAGVLIVAHDTKAARNEARAGGSPGAGAVAGSAQWFDAARGVLYLHTAPGGRLLACEKANHGRAGWGLELSEVLKPDGFSGFTAQGGLVSDVETLRAAQAAERKAAQAAERKAANGGGDGKAAQGATYDGSGVSNV